MSWDSVLRAQAYLSTALHTEPSPPCAQHTQEHTQGEDNGVVGGRWHRSVYMSRSKGSCKHKALTAEKESLFSHVSPRPAISTSWEILWLFLVAHLCRYTLNISYARKFLFHLLTRCPMSLPPGTGKSIRRCLHGPCKCLGSVSSTHCP